MKASGIQQSSIGFSFRGTAPILENEEDSHSRDEAYCWQAAFFFSHQVEISKRKNYEKTYGKCHMYESAFDLRRYASEYLGGVERSDSSDFISVLSLIMDTYSIRPFLNKHGISLETKIVTVKASQLPGLRQHIEEQAKERGRTFIESSFNEGLRRLPREAKLLPEVNVSKMVNNNNNYVIDVLLNAGVTYDKYFQIDHFRAFLHGIKDNPAFTDPDHPAYHPLLIWPSDFGLRGPEIIAIDCRGYFEESNNSSIPRYVEKDVYERCKGQPFDLTANDPAASLYQYDFLLADKRQYLDTGDLKAYLKIQCDAILKNHNLTVQYKMNIEHFLTRSQLSEKGLPLHTADLMYLMTQKHHQELFDRAKSITEKVKICIDKGWWTPQQKDVEIIRMRDCLQSLENEYHTDHALSDEMDRCLGE